MREIQNSHGPGCPCNSCRAQWLTVDGQLTSLERVSWLEKQVLEINRRLDIITKGQAAMGVALWCKTGNHAFDEDDDQKERLTTDKRDPDTGKRTGEEVTYWVCSEHVNETFTPRKKSLAELQRMIAEAEEIGE